MPITAILFDKDGTLLDYDASWMPVNREVAHRVAGGDPQLAARMLEAGGLDAKTGRVRAGSTLAAGTNAEIAAVFAAELSAPDLPAVEAMVEAGFLELGAVSATLVPGAEEACAQLAADGYMLGVATNDSEDGLQESLRGSRLWPLLAFAAGWDSGFGGKPAPGMLHGFCDAIGCKPEHVAVVGDSIHDMQMARAGGAGLRVGVLTGPSEREDLSPHAHEVLTSVADLPALLKRRL